MCGVLVPNLHTYEELVPNYRRCEELVSDKTVKNWNRMQNGADLRVFYHCEEYACMLYEI